MVTLGKLRADAALQYLAERNRQTRQDRELGTNLWEKQRDATRYYIIKRIMTLDNYDLLEVLQADPAIMDNFYATPEVARTSISDVARLVLATALEETLNNLERDAATKFAN